MRLDTDDLNWAIILYIHLLITDKTYTNRSNNLENKNSVTKINFDLMTTYLSNIACTLSAIFKCLQVSWFAILSN